MSRVFIACVLLVGLALPLLADHTSDGVITDRVRQRLVSDAEVKGYAVEVDTKDGVVTLGGKVESEKAKARAEKITKKVSGVKGVVNNLRIEPPRPRY